MYESKKLEKPVLAILLYNSQMANNCHLKPLKCLGERIPSQILGIMKGPLGPVATFRPLAMPGVERQALLSNFEVRQEKMDFLKNLLP